MTAFRRLAGSGVPDRMLWADALGVGWRMTSVVLLICAAVLPGCARHHRMTVGSPDQYDFVQERNGVTVAVEPWTHFMDVRAVFNDNLLSHGILPVRIVIFNHSKDTVSFSMTQAKLCLPDKTELSALPRCEVSERGEADETVATAYTTSLVAPILSRATAEDNWQDEKKVRKCTLDLAKLDPDEALTGFVFYDYETRPRWFGRGPEASGLRFRIRRMPRSEGSPLSFDIPFSLQD